MLQTLWTDEVARTGRCDPMASAFERALYNHGSPFIPDKADDMVEFMDCPATASGAKLRRRIAIMVAIGKLKSKDIRDASANQVICSPVFLERASAIALDAHNRCPLDGACTAANLVKWLCNGTGMPKSAARLMLFAATTEVHAAPRSGACAWLTRPNDAEVRLNVYTDLPVDMEHPIFSNQHSESAIWMLDGAALSLLQLSVHDCDSVTPPFEIMDIPPCSVCGSRWNRTASGCRTALTRDGRHALCGGASDHGLMEVR